MTVFGELNGSATSSALWDVLPITARAQTWGDEIYFSIPVTADEEDARETVELGAIGYWPPGAALCLFFGPTPASRRGEIRPASPVNLLGMIERDATALKAARAGAEITVQRA